MPWWLILLDIGCVWILAEIIWVVIELLKNLWGK